MAWVKCSNGHNYNDADNSQCPHCPIGGAEKTVIHQPSPPPPPPPMQASDVTVPAAKPIVAPPPPAAVPTPKGNETVAIIPGMAQKTATDPVVGWLVCTSGNDRGSDFRIVAGWNTIGRDPSMTICVPSDETISRTEHAKVLYETKQRAFHLAPGAGRNPVYVNGNVVLQPIQLNPFDTIELGATKLRFVPLCNEQFAWD